MVKGKKIVINRNKIKRLKHNLDIEMKKVTTSNNKKDIDNESIIVSEKISRRLKKELTFKLKHNKILVIILRKNKSAVACYIPMSCKSFCIDGNTYFNVQSGTYLMPKSMLVSVYLEGCVLPLEHNYIKYEKHFVLLTDKKGKLLKEVITKDKNNEDIKNIENVDNIDKDDLDMLPKDNSGSYLKTKKGYIIKKVLERIKGLEFDSIIANAIFDSALIERVAHGSREIKLLFWVFILCAIGLLISVIGAIISYVRI